MSTTRTSWPAVTAIARHELRQRRWALLVFGLLAGLGAGAVIGALQLANRTDTAFDRLARASKLDDARVLSTDKASLAETVGLPEVASSWTGGYFVGKVDRPGVVYSGMVSGPPRSRDLFNPVVQEGRAARPDVADEVEVNEDYPRQFGIEPGDHLQYHLLTPQELQEFDTGFGEPDGPDVRLLVTGTVRIPPNALDNAPIFGGPKFYEQYRSYAGAQAAFLRLTPTATRSGLERGVERINRLSAPSGKGPGQQDFQIVTLSFPQDGRARVQASSQVLVVGLWLFAAVAVLAGGFALGQAMGRVHSSASRDQEVEAALGLTTGERVLARVLPTGLAALLAALVAAAFAYGLSWIGPPGSLGHFEASPGALPSWPLIIGGALITALLVLLLAAAAAWRAGRQSDPQRPPRPPSAAVFGRLASPTLVAGVRFSLLRDRGDRSVPIRAAVVSAVLGIAGIVAALTFSGSLDRLQGSPARWGWPGDFAVVDSAAAAPGGPSVLDQLVADERLAAVSTFDQGPATVEGRSLNAVALARQKGNLDWTVVQGRLPTKDGEIAVGTRVAGREGVGPGDHITVDGTEGSRRLDVVGVVLLPAFDTAPVGSDVVVTKPTLVRLSGSGVSQEAIVRVADGQSVEGVYVSYADQFELSRAAPPAEVRNLGELGALPVLLGIFLGCIGAIALVQALVLVVRRRADDLAVLRALGFSTRQLAGTVAVVGLTTVAIGLAIGIPAGIAIGRFAWWIASNSAGVATDTVVPLLALGLITLAVPVVALLAAAVPSRRAASLPAGPLLRAE